MQKLARSKCVFALYFSAGFCIFILEPVMIDKTREFARETREIHENKNQKNKCFYLFLASLACFAGKFLFPTQLCRQLNSIGDKLIISLKIHV